MCPSVGVSYVGGLLGLVGRPYQVHCQALPCAKATIHWFMRLDLKMADCGTLSCPESCAGLLGVESGSRRPQGYFPLVVCEASPGASASQCAGRAMSGVPELVLGCWLVGLVPDTVGSRVQGVPKLLLACLWAGSGLSHGQGSASPRAGSGLLVCRLGPQAVGL